jgi:Family of unknown function (DUF5686)/CarboxypepD_reg-like domain
MNKVKVYTLLLFILGFGQFSFGQKTIVKGTVRDKSNGELMPFVRIQFQDTKTGCYSDSVGNYYLESYYSSDTLVFYFSGYHRLKLPVEKDQEQTIDAELILMVTEIDEVSVRPPDEPRSTTLHKRLVANKDINNKEKLDAYEYELYNKLQFDVNNLDGEFKEGRGLKKLDFVLDYMDSMGAEKPFLPVLLTESISDFYFKNRPKKKVEVMKAYQVSGSEQLSFNQFLGDMYLDVNFYDNYIPIFGKAFVSPAADFARGFYKFYLTDSSFIDNQWCYKLTFTPKRTGELTFSGDMWIHDTTYAIKQFKGNIAEDANINFILDMYFEHNFDMVAPEVWMMTEERMIADINIAQGSKIYGFYGRKYSSRKNFIINQQRPDKFYKTDETVQVEVGADTRSEEYWVKNRHKPLSNQEVRINEMVDSLEQNSYFKLLKNLSYMATTGYYVINKIEIGSIYNFFSTNPVEKYRVALSLRTSNNFSKKIEFGGRLAYGFGDERFKYLLTLRANLSESKRTLLSMYYNNDIEQLGQSATATTVGSTFGTVFRTGPLDKLSFINRFGGNLERDIKKDLILKGGFEWRSVEALGIANYVRLTSEGGVQDTLKTLSTSEIIASFRWAKGEEFISGAYDRTSLRSKFPIITFQGTFGVKGLFGSDYEYQRLDIFVDHVRPLGIFGRIKYGANAGKIFGNAAFPFLKIHEGSQSYWLLTSTFNKLNFYEFISDQYATVYLFQHWDGFILGRIPLLKKLEWRLVTGARATIGSLSSSQGGGIAIPAFTKSFNNIPYVEASVGVENIFKFGRVDIVWRLTHLTPDINPVGFRARLSFNF